VGGVAGKAGLTSIEEKRGDEGSSMAEFWVGRYERTAISTISIQFYFNSISG
jgi:hypothetical protein